MRVLKHALPLLALFLLVGCLSGGPSNSDIADLVKKQAVEEGTAALDQQIQLIQQLKQFMGTGTSNKRHNEQLEELQSAKDSLNNIEVNIDTVEEMQETPNGDYRVKALGVVTVPDSQSKLSSTSIVVTGLFSNADGGWQAKGLRVDQ